MGFFSDHKSSSAGSIPVSPNPIPNPIPEENKSSHLSARTCKLMHMSGSKMYSPVGKKPRPVWGSIHDQRKIPLHLFTIGFQKPGISTESDPTQNALPQQMSQTTGVQTAYYPLFILPPPSPDLLLKILFSFLFITQPSGLLSQKDFSTSSSSIMANSPCAVPLLSSSLCLLPPFLLLSKYQPYLHPTPSPNCYLT